MTLRLLLAGAATAMLLAAGCAHHEKPQTQAAPARAAARDDSASVETSPNGISQSKDLNSDANAPAGPQGLDVLARKTESYSKSLEPLLTKRNPPQPASQESAVQWMNKDEFALGAAPRGEAPASATDEPKATVQPAIDITNRGAPTQAQAPQSTARDSKSLASANLPASVPPPAPQNRAAALAPAAGSIEAFEAKLAKRVADYPRDLSAQLEYQLWLYLRDQPVPQLSTISTLPSEDREVLTALMDGLTNFRNTIRAENNMLLSKKIRPLVEAADRLRTQSDLSIPKIALCSSVKGFGQYEAIEPRFPANAEAKAILYCEIENFSAQLNDQQQWTSELKLEAVLYAEDSLQVWSDKAERVLDSSRNRRRDFFIRKFVTLPKNLGIGRYLLKVSVTDEQANHIAESTLPITVVAQ